METTTKTLETLTTTEVAERSTGRSKVRIHKYTGKENQMVSLVEASMLTRSYRESVEKGSVKGHYFGRNIFEKVLSQEGCVGVRTYFGAFDDGSPTLVHVGVDQDGIDLVRGYIGDASYPCPPFCSKDNLINADLADRLIPLRNGANVFTGKENHGITLAEARTAVAKYRETKEDGAINAVYYSRDLYERLLSQNTCVGIRFYYGKDADVTTFVLVGVDSKGNDLVALTGDGSYPCPPFCTPDASL